MLDNPPTDAPPSAQVKRYAPPNQRNKGINRRKSGDRANGLHSIEGEKNMGALANESARSRLIPAAGCATSEVAQLLNDRWQSTIHKAHNSTDPSEKPVVFASSTGPAWGQFKLPHQMLAASSPPAPQIDFLAELKRQRSLQKSDSVSNYTINQKLWPA